MNDLPPPSDPDDLFCTQMLLTIPWMPVAAAVYHYALNDRIKASGEQS